MGHISDNVTLDNPAFIHESAWLYGKVTIGPGASVWPNVVTRAETYEIRIGARTNIQDFVMIHVGAASHYCWRGLLHHASRDATWMHHW